MGYLNEWLDFLRVGMFLLSLWCFIVLIRRWRSYASDWTDKTKDYWYALLMWTVVGQVVSIQAIYLDRPFTPATVAVIAAVLVTGKGLHTKGSWGGDDA